MNIRPAREPTVPTACGAALLALTLSSQAAFAQTLNQATTAQLAADGSFVPCELLLGGDDPTLVLTGPLVSICTRFVDMAGPPSSSSGGGFAATPPSAPAAVDARLEKDTDEIAGTSTRGFFLTVGTDSIDRIATPFEDGYDSDVVRIAAGFDKLFGRNKIFGFAVDASEQEGDFLDGGNFEIGNAGLTGFGSLLIGEQAAFNFYAGLAQLSNERLRRATFREVSGDSFMPTFFSVEGTPRADFDADQTLFGFQYSYDWSWDNFTFGPRIGYDWNRTEYDTYSEIDSVGLGLTFHNDEETSSQWSAGFVGSVAVSTSFGVVVIEESLLYRYESDQDQRDVQVSFVEDTRARRFSYQTERPDRDFLEFSVGATFVLKNGVQVLAEYRGITSHDYLDSNAIAVGFRNEF
jgi:uncharacterized protein YhjY with autotransporter beta-barrel domain